MKRYWVIAPYENKYKRGFEQSWEYDLKNGVIAIGWRKLGDVRKLTDKQLKCKIKTEYLGRKEGYVFGALKKFYNEIEKGDTIIARRGLKKIVGIGKVVNKSFYNEEMGRARYLGRGEEHIFPNFIRVNWQEKKIDFKTSVFNQHTISETSKQNYISLLQEKTTSIKPMRSFIIANITWNPTGWRNAYINPQAGHVYARKHPGHESLNFNFAKPIDKNGKVHGYVQWTYPPKEFSDGGVIIFYARNIETNKGEIVGIYGDVKILALPKKTPYPGFQEKELYSNIIAEENLSMLFPIPLLDKKYKHMLAIKRLVPQIGFRIIDDMNLAKTIVKDEIIALQRSGIWQAELEKLNAIYAYITGESYRSDLQYDDKDLKEQDEILKILRARKEDKKGKIIKDLKNLTLKDPEVIRIQGKAYKRDNKTIVQLKILRDFKCQICNMQILKKDGSFYVEAAHIIPKYRKGLESPENILILCPNHHKEFDLGEKEIISHSKNKVFFKLNNEEYVINLRI